MNVYSLGVGLSIALYLIIGSIWGKKVKNVDDYYVAGRRAPVILIVGSLVASFLSTGVFMGDTGEVYQGFFVPIVIVGVIQATGYLWGSLLFGVYIRRSGVLTVPEYFGKRFQSERIRKLAAISVIISVTAYMLSAVQGISTLLSSITGLNYKLCILIAWLAFTAFTIYAGSAGVLITDTVMFLIFLVAAVGTVPFIAKSSGGWIEAMHMLSESETCPGIVSWHANLEYLYPTGWMNLSWAVLYGLVWAVVVMVSPWQTSRYLMAKNEKIVLRSSVWASMAVMVITIMIYFSAAFIQLINPDLVPSECMIWAAQNLVPTVVGVVMITGILAAGLSSASTFLSLIGFSVANDLLMNRRLGDRKKLIISRVVMFAVGLVVLVIALINPPQIFWIMYFGGTVIAASWGCVSLFSVWSLKISERGAFWGMLSGLIVCVICKFLSGLDIVAFPFWADAFVLGFSVSLIGILIGSYTKKPSAAECEERKRLFIVPESERETEELEKSISQARIYPVFAIIIMVGLMILWALPYLGVI